jgi:predicted RNase H-like HicB family nuclease
MVSLIQNRKFNIKTSRVKEIGDKMKAYIALIEEGENSYSVVFPDVHGVITVGDTYEEAIKNAHEALAFHLEDEAALPQERTLKQIKATWDDWPTWGEKDGNFTVEHIVLGLNEETPDYSDFNSKVLESALIL